MISRSFLAILVAFAAFVVYSDACMPGNLNVPFLQGVPTLLGQNPSNSSSEAAQVTETEETHEETVETKADPATPAEPAPAAAGARQGKGSPFARGSKTMTTEELEERDQELETELKEHLSSIEKRRNERKEKLAAAAAAEVEEEAKKAAAAAARAVADTPSDDGSETTLEEEAGPVVDTGKTIVERKFRRSYKKTVESH